MEQNQQLLHAILFPVPLQGHVIPFIHLALKLASNGVTVTFVNTHSTDHLIVESQTKRTAGDIFAGARNSGLNIHYVTIDDGSPVDFDRSLYHDQYFMRLIEVLPANADELLGKLVEEDDNDPRINCIIADTFYPNYPSALADKYGLVNVSFWTQSLLAFTLYYHWDLIRSHSHGGSQGNKEDEIDYVPGVGSIKRKDLMSTIQSDDTTSIVHRATYLAFQHINNVDLIIANTVAELEPETLETLNKKWPLYAIGPILPTGFTKGSVATSMWSESDCTHWLNTKPKGSVLYISFGSYAHMTKQVIKEIAHGLLLSGVHFIWVLRSDIVSSDEPYLLPDGFEQQVNDKGLVVSWCYQMDVISHPAIGGFLTHCGWNSILEGIWCGVPLLCYPLLTDQPTNRKLVVDDWRIGLNLCDGNSVTREEVAAKINSIMLGKSAVRERIDNTRRMLVNALAPSGSSDKNFKQLINKMKALLMTKSCQ